MSERKARMWEELYFAISQHADLNREYFELVGRLFVLKHDQEPNPAMVSELQVRINNAAGRRDDSLIRLTSIREEYEGIVHYEYED